MVTTTPDTHRASRELAAISADLRRPGVAADDLIAIGARLSRIGTEIAIACERAFLVTADDVAA